MEKTERSSLELLISDNPDAFLPTLVIYHSQKKSGLITSDISYDEWIKKQVETSTSKLGLKPITLKHDPKAKK